MEESKIIEKTNEALWFLKGWHAYQDNYGCIGQNLSEAEGNITGEHLIAIQEAIESLKTNLLTQKSSRQKTAAAD